MPTIYAEISAKNEFREGDPKTTKVQGSMTVEIDHTEDGIRRLVIGAYADEDRIPRRWTEKPRSIQREFRLELDAEALAQIVNAAIESGMLRLNVTASPT